jgi:hypothetical protein
MPKRFSCLASSELATMPNRVRLNLFGCSEIREMLNPLLTIMRQWPLSIHI